MKKWFGLVLVALLAVVLTACNTSQDGALELQGATKGNLRINVLLNTDASPQVLAELGKYGQVRDVLEAIDAVTMNAKADQLPAIRALPFVAAANPDAERLAAPVDTVEVEDFTDGLNTWDQDAVNVTDFDVCNALDENGDPILDADDNPIQVPCGSRTEEFTGEGVYVAVLDTGLVDSWRQFFPEERIAEEYAKSFGGGGGERGNISEQPNKWEHDQNSYGTHVTSTILGFNYGGTHFNGTAPEATVIPVKVLNQNGSGWSSVVAAGIEYIGDLKAGPLADHPVVINMSLGGPVLDAVEKAALDYAIDQGVIVVASAGNSGEAGMGYPGAYPPVISVAASGWIGEWTAPAWWYALDVSDPTEPDDFYITDFSSRELPGQDLDVAAPGSWVVGPYKLNSNNQPTYYYLGGTSMASPHVAGIAALMMQKNVSLVQEEVEDILEDTAIPFDFGGQDEICRGITGPAGPETVCWGPDATGAGLATADAALGAIP